MFPVCVLSRTAALAAAALTSACFVSGAPGEDDPPPEPVPPSGVAVDSPPASIATDLCDDDTYDGVDWDSTHSAHFDLYYLPGTAAEHDACAIRERLEAAYQRIRLTLGVTAEPTFSVYLSPSRVAAAARGLAFGRSYPAEGVEEVVYTGAPDSYEVLRYGHELTHLLEYHLADDHAARLPILREGLAEYLDQSGRDMHDAYALQLLAGTETRVHVASFESRDVSGRNYGRAGSLVAFLVDRYGMATFLDLFRATDGEWPQSAAELTSMLDAALTATVGEGWADVEPAWEAEVQAALARVDVTVTTADRGEIEQLFQIMDRAIARDDGDLYRTTMEGFYCDWGGEAIRTEIADRVVVAYGETTSSVASIVATGVKNFRTAQVVTRRTDERGVDSFLTFTVEHVPVGWRVAWGPDWY